MISLSPLWHALCLTTVNQPFSVTFLPHQMLLIAHYLSLFKLNWLGHWSFLYNIVHYLGLFYRDHFLSYRYDASTFQLFIQHSHNHFSMIWLDLLSFLIIILSSRSLDFSHLTTLITVPNLLSPIQGDEYFIPMFTFHPPGLNFIWNQNFYYLPRNPISV